MKLLKVDTMATTLAISHYLYLSEEERYNWYAGGDVTVVGVSCPVWYQKGKTSEPAVEVFARYTLINDPAGVFVRHNDEGYKITVPPTSPPISVLSDSAWNKMTPLEQELWHQENQPQPCIASLLNVKDGGAGYLAFRQFTKVRKGRRTLNVVHYVEIKDIAELTNTLT